MTNFDLPAFAPPQPDPPPPPVDPAVARQRRIVDDTTVEQEINRVMGEKRDLLFDRPDAFHRTQGADAIHAAPVATQRLLDLKGAALDATDNDFQRRKLADALDAHVFLARDGIARHVAEQSLVWQRKTALDRIDLLVKEAALHHTIDDGRSDAMAEAAANAARAHARVGDIPPLTEVEEQAAASARSRVLAATVQARIDAGNTEGATQFYERNQDQLTADHAQSLGDQLQGLRRTDDARAYAAQLAPPVPPASHDEARAWHADATAQNQLDHAEDVGRQGDVQHFLDVSHALSKRALDAQRAALDKAVEDWISTPRADGRPQIDPPTALWHALDEAEQEELLKRLRLNESPADIVPMNSSPGGLLQPDIRVAATPESAYAECVAECAQKFSEGLPRPKWFSGSDMPSLIRLCIRACLAEKGDHNY